MVSLPLDGGTGLGREVVEDAVHSLHLCEDALRYLVEQRPGDFLYCCRHGILGVDRTYDHGPVP